MSGYDNSKQVILSSVTSDNPNAPAMRVEWTDGTGQKQKAGLWLWERKDGTPVLDKQGKKQYIGKYEEDNYAQQVQDKGIVGANKALNEKPEGFADLESDIPFAPYEKGSFV